MGVGAAMTGTEARDRAQTKGYTVKVANHMLGPLTIMHVPKQPTIKRRPDMMIAIDQYGHTELGLYHPRKDLTKRHGLSSSSAHKMYHDKNDGTSVHVGYIVHGHWYTLYEIVPWEGKTI